MSIDFRNGVWLAVFFAFFEVSYGSSDSTDEGDDLDHIYLESTATMGPSTLNKQFYHYRLTDDHSICELKKKEVNSVQRDKLPINMVVLFDSSGSMSDDGKKVFGLFKSLVKNITEMDKYKLELKLTVVGQPREEDGKVKRKDENLKDFSLSDIPSVNVVWNRSFIQSHNALIALQCLIDKGKMGAQDDPYGQSQCTPKETDSFGNVIPNARVLEGQKIPYPSDNDYLNKNYFTENSMNIIMVMTDYCSGDMGDYDDDKDGFQTLDFENYLTRMYNLDLGDKDKDNKSPFVDTFQFYAFVDANEDKGQDGACQNGGTRYHSLVQKINKVSSDEDINKYYHDVFMSTKTKASSNNLSQETRTKMFDDAVKDLEKTIVKKTEEYYECS